MDNIYKIDRYMDSNGKEILQLTDIKTNVIKYGINVPVPTRDGNISTALMELKDVNNIDDAFAKFESAFKEHLNELKKLMQQQSLVTPPTPQELKLVRE